MPADDIVVKKIPAPGVALIAGRAPAIGADNIVPVVNRLYEQFDELRIRDSVHLAQPVTGPPGELPPPGRYRVLPEMEAAVAVRNGPAASIVPMVYTDLVRWIEESGYRAVPSLGREVWVHEVDDIADIEQQVSEIQVPFTRPGAPAS